MIKFDFHRYTGFLTSQMYYFQTIWKNNKTEKHRIKYIEIKSLRTSSVTSDWFRTRHMTNEHRLLELRFALGMTLVFCKLLWKVTSEVSTKLFFIKFISFDGFCLIKSLKCNVYFSNRVLYLIWEERFFCFFVSFLKLLCVFIYKSNYPAEN